MTVMMMMMMTPMTLTITVMAPTTLATPMAVVTPIVTPAAISSVSTPNARIVCKLYWAKNDAPSVRALSRVVTKSKHVSCATTEASSFFMMVTKLGAATAILVSAAR